MAVAIGMEIDAAAFRVAGERYGPQTMARLVSVASKLSAIEGEKLTLLGFRESKDPYDEPWEPLKHRDGVPLIDTGRLRSSFHGRPTADGFSVGTNVVYSKWHQTGFTVDGGRTVTKARGKKGRFVKSGSKKHTYTTRHVSKEVVVPARPMLPTRERGWGPKWSKGIKSAVLMAFRQVLGAK